MLPFWRRSRSDANIRINLSFQITSMRICDFTKRSSGSEGDYDVARELPRHEALGFVEQCDGHSRKTIPATRHSVRMLSRARADIKQSFDKSDG